MQDVIIERSGPVVSVVFNRTNVRNAISHSMLAEVYEAAITAERARARLFALRGAGPVFSAGADVKQLASFTEQEMKANVELGHKLTSWLETAPVATVAVMQGVALGGAFELALACDIRLATEGCQMGLPEPTLGSLPGWGGISRLHRLAPAITNEMVLTGRVVQTDRAVVSGLVHAIVENPHDGLDDIRDSIMRVAPNVIGPAKRLIALSHDLDSSSLREASVNAVMASFEDPERSEGLSAFLNKRRPSWMTSGTTEG